MSHIVYNPKIILVRPQMQENIGATARAMANFSLNDLSLVNPREELCEKAYAMSSGATYILDNVKYYDSVTNAVSECQYIIATTARGRSINKPTYALEEGIKLILHKQAQGQKCGILFGPERTGLENDDLMLADSLIHVPVNPEFASLNLAQCVLLVAYEYFKQAHHNNFDYISSEPLANKNDINHMINHLITELDQSGFFFPPEKRLSSVTLISNIFSRNNLTEQEVRTLRGVIKALVKIRQQ
jgi:tRNA/rRNA methyltransferase